MVCARTYTVLSKIDPKYGKYQFWGIRKSGTTHVLIDILHQWYMGKDVKVLFSDYSKAFVGHNQGLCV